MTWLGQPVNTVLDIDIQTTLLFGHTSQVVLAITCRNVDILQLGLICRDKMTNDKYQTLLSKALTSARKE